MKKRILAGAILLAAVLVLSGLISPVLQAQSGPPHVTATGFVSCSMCLIPGLCQNQTRLACVQMWVTTGASYVLVVGDSHYILAGEPADLLDAASKTEVTITGVLVPIPRFSERTRPASFLDFLRPTMQLEVTSITTPSKKHFARRAIATRGL